MVEGSAKDPDTPGMTYRDAGVDIDAQDRALALIKGHLKATRTPGVLSDLGSFGGLFRVPADVPDPVLVASADGVGTKLMVAWKANRHDTVGEDLVNHCVNDILVMGARPLFFLDYLATGKLDPAVAERLVAGVARGCRANGCALIGGETAEMPEMYGAGEYDLAGTIVGIVARDAILDGSKVQVGDLAYGLPSTGLHTNGYSLARRIVFGTMGLGPDDEIPGTGQSAADALLAVHKSYLAALDGALAQGLVHALAHITGGGLTDNVPRVLPEETALAVELGSWPVPPLFTALHRAGRVPDDDMLRTFNMGVGMVALVSPASAAAFETELAARGERAWRIGKVVPGERRVVYGGTLR
ncbi:MAG: phosphoribosylformylglycinamidine cyclo-ligase [Acidobacteria bacterium]|nr:phosphoribosylformylglycinamidine cyclo-ligase [Acidobacteriota bacterium]